MKLINKKYIEINGKEGANAVKPTSKTLSNKTDEILS
jgi:hypothetical protein